VAEVEGDVEEVDGVVRVTKLRAHYRGTIPAGSREKAERAVKSHPEKCPAYASVRDAIALEVSSSFEEA
jgi:uncharacterized OsmC-like protein